MKLSRVAESLAAAQIAHPWRFLIGALVVTAITGLVASDLQLDSSYNGLLPDDSPQLATVRDVQARTGGTRQLVVALGGDDVDARLAFGRRLVERLRAVDGVRCVDLEMPVDFFADRGIWLLETDELEELADAAQLAVERFRTRGDGNALRLFFGRVRDTLEARRHDLPYDRGVLTSRDGRYTFVLVVPSVSLLDIASARDVFDRIQTAIAELDPAAAGVEVHYAGTLRMFQETHQRIGTDLRNASILAFVLGILLVAGFTRRPAAPVVVGASLLPGIVWTFAVTRATSETINMVTGFLVAVLVGLGIDFGVHLYMRFQQEYAHETHDPMQALVRTVVGTLAPAVTSAATTAGTFFCFTISDFPGFNEFGYVAGMGVLLTLVSTFLILPPLLVVSTRCWASGVARKELVGSSPPDRRARRLPTSVAIGLVAAGVVVAAYGLVYGRDVPFRNDFERLRGRSEALEFNEYVNQSLGVGFNPTVVLVDDVDDAARVASIARDRANRPGQRRDGPRIGRILSLADLVPRDVAARRVQIERLRALVEDPALRRAVDEGFLDAEHLNLARHLLSARPWTESEVPEPLRRRFTTLDGRQAIVYLWSTYRIDSDTEAYLWEAELDGLSRAIEQGGVHFTLVDERLVSAWLSRMVLEDTPKVLPFTVVVVFLVLLLDFRSLREAIVVSVPLAVGMLGFLGAAHLLGVELNLFNMIVVPSVIGIGIDATVHIYHRYRAEGPGSVVFVLERTGVAVFVASFTTAIGFGSSLICYHVGLQTVGTLAILGIGSTFLSATLFFPGLLTLLESWGRRRGAGVD